MKKLLSTLFLLCFSILAFCQTTVTVTLTGTLTSKAPDATSVTYLWKQIQGGSGVITNPTSLVTTVTGLPAGISKFQLQGTDNLGNKSSLTDPKSIVTITVLNSGILPVVNAGTDQTVTLGSTGFVNNNKTQVYAFAKVK